LNTPHIAAVDTGTAYGMKSSSYKAALTEVGRSTPCGEFMRRYWLCVLKTSSGLIW
jgi:hypothetical protein